MIDGGGECRCGGIQAPASIYLSLRQSHVESIYYVLSVKRDEGLTCTRRLVDQARRTRLVVAVSGPFTRCLCVSGPHPSPSGLCGTTRARSHKKIGTRRAILSRTSGKSYREERSNPCTLVSVRILRTARYSIGHRCPIPISFAGSSLVHFRLARLLPRTTTAQKGAVQIAAGTQPLRESATATSKSTIPTTSAVFHAG